MPSSTLIVSLLTGARGLFGDPLSAAISPRGTDILVTWRGTGYWFEAVDADFRSNECPAKYKKHSIQWELWPSICEAMTPFRGWPGLTPEQRADRAARWERENERPIPQAVRDSWGPQ